MKTIPDIPKDLDFDKIWFLFQETDRKFQETDRKFQETDRKFQDTDRKFQDTDRAIKDTDRAIKDTDRAIKDTDRAMKDTNRAMKDTDKKIRELSGLFTTQWGKLIESLVQPACLHLFKERGIDIERSMENVKAKHEGETMEIDVLLINDSELVIVEVKTTCRPKYINKLKNDLAAFKTFFPEFKHYKVYGAIAALKYDAESDKYAYRNGLFVIKTTGEGIVKIDNDKDFKPTAY